MAFLVYKDFLSKITRKDLAEYTAEPHQYETEPSELEPYDDEAVATSPATIPVPALTILAQAQMDAEEEVASYLRGRYDMEAAYAATGADRNAQLVMYLVDVTIWHLTPRTSYNQVSEIREKRYKAAISWLMLAQAGKTNPKLPDYAATNPATQAHKLLRWGSAPAQVHGF